MSCKIVRRARLAGPSGSVAATTGTGIGTAPGVALVVLLLSEAASAVRMAVAILDPVAVAVDVAVVGSPTVLGKPVYPARRAESSARDHGGGGMAVRAVTPVLVRSRESMAWLGQLMPRTG